VNVDTFGRDRRLLFLAATSRDAATTETMLSPLGIHLYVCRRFEDLLRELKAGAGAILLPEEAASPGHKPRSARCLLHSRRGPICPC
jgi:hypothetical protein